MTESAAPRLFQIGKKKPHSSQAREAGLGVQRATTGEPPELVRGAGALTSLGNVFKGVDLKSWAGLAHGAAVR